MTSLFIGPGYIFIAAILWGVDGVLRRSLYSLPPSTIVFYEHLIGLLLIAPFLIKAWRSERLTRDEWWTVGLVSLFSGLIGTLLFTAALAKVNFIAFSVVFLVQKLQPIFTAITARLVLGERLARQFVYWAALALVAGFFVTFPTGSVNLGGGGDHLAAALLAFGAAIAWGSSTAFSRKLLLNHSYTFITGVRFLLTVPLALLAVFLFKTTSTLSTLSLEQAGYLLAIGCSTGMVALWIYYRGLTRTAAHVSAFVELAFPMTAIFIEVVLYQTTLSLVQYLAAAVLLFAVYRIAKINRAE